MQDSLHKGVVPTHEAWRRAQNYWRSVDLGRNAAAAFLRNKIRSRSEAVEQAAAILKHCPDSHMETAIIEFSFLLGPDYAVHFDDTAAGDMRLRVYSKNALMKVFFGDSEVEAKTRC